MQGAYIVSIDGDENAVFTGKGLDKQIEQPIEYISTRAHPSSAKTQFKDVLFTGLAPDGGLYIPTNIPQLSIEKIMSWKNLSYAEVAANVMTEFLKDTIPYPDLLKMCKSAYSSKLWSSSKVVPIKTLQLNHSELMYVAELFHGPTCSFKDLAMQMVGRMFSYFLEKDGKSITVLAATSGDTGSAAIAGLQGLKGIKVVILYPKGKISRVQELQMTTAGNENVFPVAVDGASFDDCQRIVKAAFNNPEFRKKHSLTAVNSINWARILAQIPYYVWTYLRWREVTNNVGDLTVSVPTGNFGNALSAYYARQMGLPLAKIHVATNANDGLHRFISKGEPIKDTEVISTFAPSMDIGKSSNIERWMGTTDEISDHFTSSACVDDDIFRSIQTIETESGYIICPHTATAVHGINTSPDVFEALMNRSLVIMATAHPAKFIPHVDKPKQLENLDNMVQTNYTVPNSEDAIMAFINTL
jgi:threonine synthase